MASGGRRIGSGRKSSLPGEKRVQLVITIAPCTKERLKALAKDKGISPGKLIDEMINRGGF